MFNVYAVKTRKRQGNAWMPPECVVRLEGAGGELLLVCGWSTEPDRGRPMARLRRNLPRIKRQWAEEYGKSWRLEIR